MMIISHMQDINCTNPITVSGNCLLQKCLCVSEREYTENTAHCLFSIYQFIHITKALCGYPD